MSDVPLRIRIVQVLLWICVINWAIYIGGTIYQMVVIVPQWSAAIPESLRAFYAGAYVHLGSAHFFGYELRGGFWLGPFRLILLLVALLLSWRSVLHRKCLLISCIVSVVFLAGFTLIYIYPINHVLFGQAGG